MRRARLFWKLYVTYLTVIVLCTVGVGALAQRSARSFYFSHTRTELTDRASLVQAELASTRAPLTAAQLEPIVRRWGEASHTRLTLIAADGTVLAESARSPAGMQNHNTPNRPEVQEALSGHMGYAIHKSPTLGVPMMYVTLPTRNVDGVAVVQVALPLTAVDHSINTLTWRIVLVGAVVAVLAALVGLYASSRISRQMGGIRRGAERIAGGDFAHTLAVPPTEEFAAVADSLNQMAVDLDQKIRTITRERNERDAVLSSMIEGVLAVDRDENVIAANEALGGVLDVEPEEAIGRSIQAVVRNPELQRFITRTLASETPVEGEIAARVGHEDRTLQANGTRLRGAQGGLRGAVIVLNDITRLKRLEAVRRDFVANVSHELKTPVTSIKGFAETLLDGALDDAGDAERFVRIIAGQAERLNAIIGDLLALSSLELAGEQGPIMSEASIDDVLEVAVEVCGMKAQAKEVTLALTSHDGVLATVNPPLLEQAVVNLIDNAIKFSPAGSTVEVACVVNDGEIHISVRDEGPGVSREHMPRLFERFYRVDKARSRNLGGTGLGLAIVKHIAQVHGGRAEVQSVLGQGSTFTISLPLSPQP
jgi:two-component system phosphate regulon sensor histidine kinase PhoR